MSSAQKAKMLNPLGITDFDWHSESPDLKIKIASGDYPGLLISW